MPFVRSLQPRALLRLGPSPRFLKKGQALPKVKSSTSQSFPPRTRASYCPTARLRCGAIGEPSRQNAIRRRPHMKTVRRFLTCAAIVASLELSSLAALAGQGQDFPNAKCTCKECASNNGDLIGQCNDVCKDKTVY